MTRDPRYITYSDTSEQLDEREPAKRVIGLRAPMTHSGRALCKAAQAILSPKSSGNSDVGVCMVTNGSSASSYCSFQRSLLAQEPTLRHYSTSVPNAAVSELCLSFGLTGPAVTFMEDGTDAFSDCPQIDIAVEWLSSGAAQKVLIGAIDVNTRIPDLTECVLITLDQRLAEQFAQAANTATPAPGSVALLRDLAESVGLSEAKGDVNV